MPFSDDIILRLGLDPRPFNKGLNTAKSKILSFGKQLGGMFAVSGGVALGRKILQFADSIDTMSKTIGTSAEFLQGWQQANIKSGVAVEKSTMGLQRFSRRLAEAQQGTGVMKDEFAKLGINLRDRNGQFRSLESVLADYTDVIAGTKNEQEQLRLAFKAFDSEGAQMVATLKQGSATVSKLIEDAAKLTNEEAEQLAAANVQLEKFDRDLTVTGGKLIGFLRKLTEFKSNTTGVIGPVIPGQGIPNQPAAFAAGDDVNQDRAARIIREIKQTKQEILDIDQDEEITIYNIRREEEVRLDAEKAILQAKKDSLGISRMQQLSDRSGFTVGELASLRPGSPLFSAAAIPSILAAQQVQGLEFFAKGAKAAGNFAGSELATNRALEIRNGMMALTESERNPLGDLTEQQRETNARLTEILKREADLGLKIQPINGR